MASGSDVKVTVTIEPEDARKLAAEVFELRERLKEAEDRAASWEALDAEAQIGADEVSRQLRDLKAELADVRAQWASDVGSAIARAQTAEARAARLNTEVGYLLEENEEMGRREMQRAAAARKVARYAAQATASMGAMEEQVKDARAEAARLDKQNWNLCARINASEYARMTAEAETARWKYETRKYTCRCAGDDHHDGCTYATIAAALRGPAQSEKRE